MRRPLPQKPIDGIGFASMFTTLVSDSNSQNMVAVEASTNPPATNRPPHIVCQLCRSKKLKCSGYSPDACVRCRASGVECLPVERPRGEKMPSRPSRQVTKTSSETSTRNTSSRNMSPTMNNVASSFANISNPDLVGLSPNTPSSGSNFSPSTLFGGLSGAPSFPQDIPSLNPYMVDSPGTENHLQIGDIPLLPEIGVDVGLDASPISNPEAFKFNTPYEEDVPSSQDPEQRSSASLPWQEMFDMMIQSSSSTPQSCQCTDRALELLDWVFIQDCSSKDELSISKTNPYHTAAAMQDLSSLRMAIHSLERFATCARCRQASRLMTILVLLSERLSTKTQLVLEKALPGIFETRIDLGKASSPISSNRDHYAIPGCQTQSRVHQPQIAKAHIKIILSCDAFTLDMSKEVEALLLTLALLVLQQLRKVVATLWGRAQEEKRKDFSENLIQSGQRLHAMNTALKSRFIKEYD